MKKRYVEKKPTKGKQLFDCKCYRWNTILSKIENNRHMTHFYEYFFFQFNPKVS